MIVLSNNMMMMMYNLHVVFMWLRGPNALLLLPLNAQRERRQWSIFSSFLTNLLESCTHTTEIERMRLLVFSLVKTRIYKEGYSLYVCNTKVSSVGNSGVHILLLIIRAIDIA